jgi:hypothetical protein
VKKLTPRKVVSWYTMRRTKRRYDPKITPHSKANATVSGIISA